jgi:hypothetical protein
MSLEPSEHLTPDGEYLVRDSGLQVTPSTRTGSFMKPDFVMVGVQNGAGGVLLFASMSLTDAELRREVQAFDLVPVAGRVASIPRMDITVTAKMLDFTVIHADSYGEAVQSLQEQWARNQQPEPGNALPPGI